MQNNLEDSRHSHRPDKSPQMVGLGEVLWDLLPSGRVLGGAPANFAYMATVFGDQGVVASRVGDDELGREACAVMDTLGVNTSYIQYDNQNETGTAGVIFDLSGQPKFSIKKPAAWDFLQWTTAWEELSSRVDVVCFGSLAQRSPTSAEAIENFLRNTPASALLICDANLRDPFYSAECLRRSFSYADVLKLNDQELVNIASLLGMSGGDDRELAEKLFHEFDLELICITRGARGSLLISEFEMVEHPGIRAEVADAIGAGDAFTACVAHYYLQGCRLEEISESANRFAAWVATQVGATPLISPAQLSEILSVCRSSSSS